MSEAVKPTVKPTSGVHWVLIAALAGLVAIAALPNYLSGQWPWSNDLQVPQLAELRELRKTPISVPGWELQHQQEVSIGGNPWGLAEYRLPGHADAAIDGNFILLVRPQTSHDKQPEVEWVDLQGSQGWQIDDRHTVRLTVDNASGQPIPVTARYFRGIGDNRTFAIMQWYAWPTGGHFAPGKWFWADQGRQWRHGERMPWIAVSVLLPIEPVGDIRPHTDAMVAIAQAVHQSLLMSTWQS
jgi:cyanoexosortase B-associated protein